MGKVRNESFIQSISLRNTGFLKEIPPLFRATAKLKEDVLKNTM